MVSSVYNFFTLFGLGSVDP